MLLPEIKNVAFDWHDTLVYGREIFIKHEEMAYSTLAAVLPYIPRENIKAEIENLNKIFFDTHFVDPNRWSYVFTTFKQRHSEVPNYVISQCLDTILDVYREMPRLIEGADETLTVLRDQGKRLGLVTHAWFEWVEPQIVSTGMMKHFGNRIHYVDINGPKGAMQWKEGLDKFGFCIQDTAIVGDSPRSDTGPAKELKVKQVLLIDVTRWDIHNTGTQEGVEKINSVRDLVEK